MEVIRNECISKLKVVQILQKAYAEGRIQAKDGLVSVLDDINATDVQPVKRGHWELIDGQEKWIQGYTCSECGQVVVTYECNFCPNCGADMRGDENG